MTWAGVSGDPAMISQLIFPQCWPAMNTLRIGIIMCSLTILINSVKKVETVTTVPNRIKDVAGKRE